MDRNSVYAMIDGEREYQESRWGALGMVADENHSVADWIIYMEQHLTNAKRQAYNLNPKLALCEIRKVAALAVACMEHNDTPTRAEELEARDGR